jgi:hypothetical protein
MTLLKQAVLSFLKTESVSQNKIYFIDTVQASHTECAVLSGGWDEFHMGVFQKYSSNNKRFISITSMLNEVLAVSTPFKPFKDNTLHDMFVLPSDSVPGMYRGGYTKINYEPKESFLKNQKVTWSNSECGDNYYLVALMDRVIDMLDGVKVKDGENIEWVTGKNFEAVRVKGGPTKTSLLRFRIPKIPGEEGVIKVILMGFFRNSLTINLSEPPHHRERMLDSSYEDYTHAGVRGDSRTVIMIKYYFSVRLYDRAYRMQQCFYKTTNRGMTVVTGTPQIEAGYNYRDWLWRTVEMPGRFHEVFKNRAHHTGAIQNWSYVFTYNEPNMDLDERIFSGEHEFDRFIARWENFIGRACRRHKDGEEVYIAPNFQLLSFEGEYTPSSLKIHKNGWTKIEGCDVI